MHAFLLVLALLPSADDEPDYLPGIAVETTIDEKIHRRVEDAIAYEGAASRVHWTGRLFVNRDDAYRFSAQFQGRVTLRIADKILFDGDAKNGWLRSPPLELEFGYYPLRVDYRPTDGPGRFALFWQGKQFERERVPAWALVRDPSTKDYDLGQRGEMLARAGRCSACHALPIASATLRAPSLRAIRNAISPSWLVEFLTDPSLALRAGNAHSPTFELSADVARAVTVFLLKNSETPAIPPSSKGDAANGRKLTERIGCLACHTINKVGTAAPLGGGDLSRIADKRPPGFFAVWLQQPERLNPLHRMPVFPLEKKEIADISAYLATLGGPAKLDVALAESADAGRKIVTAKGCANCHEIPGITAERPRTWKFQTERLGCLGKPNAGHPGPVYRFAADDRHALTAFLSTPEPARKTDGMQLLTDNNCLQCHARGNYLGLRAVVAQLGVRDPKVQAGLIPPALHGVGDKLLPEWLATAVAGKAPRLRPWLAPRMPHFPFAAGEIEALSAALISDDRVPELDERKPSPAKPEELFLAAHRLVGSNGLSCVSCHAIGSALPAETQPGALGPDLRLLGERLRPSWFRRFTRDPARLWPGIEMPAIQQALPGVLGGDVEAQRAALWHGLNSPTFTPPTANAVQVLTVPPEGPAVILRDLFEHGPGQSTVRPFAVGLPNGHNILIDLDTLSLRRWWIGDFARQKVRGKKWYWETAGVTIFDQPESPSLFDLKPPEKGDTLGWLEWYENSTDSIRLRVRLRDGTGTVELTITPAVSGCKILLAVSRSRTHLRDITTPRGVSIRSIVHQAQLDGWTAELRCTAATVPTRDKSSDSTLSPPKPRSLPTMAGFEVVRLPLDDGPMPTAFAFRKGKLLAASLKGGIYELEDTDGDGLPDRYRRFDDYLSAPFGMLVEGDDVLVAHRHELLRLKDGGRRSEVIATGWGVSADYHDWSVGPVRDADGNYYLSLSCQEDNRSPAAARGRGKVLRIASDGKWTEYAAGLRYGMGIVANPRGDLFVTDNQGVTNPFNELNHIRPGRHFGFFNKLDSLQNAPSETLPAIQIPHPWTRSVNGVALIPEGFGPFAGQLVGADYTTRKLIRLSLQRIGETYQGAAYPFSRDDMGLIARDETFLGPVAVAFGPDGCLYVGSMIDSGWGGGNNRGAIERVKYIGPVPFGIREVRAHAGGFIIDFTAPVDPRRAMSPEQYALSCYRRIHRGGYETPDQDRTRVAVERVEISADRRSVKLFVKPLRPTFVYDIGIGAIHAGKEKPFPAVAFYTLNEVPKE